MKAIALVLSLCLSLNVLAASGTVQDLEKSFDNYTYSITVEWDQKDKAFYNEVTLNFFKELKAQLDNGSISKSDILALAEKRIQNKSSLESLRTLLQLELSKDMSPEEIVRILQAQSKNFYHQGASWNGDVYTVGGIVVIAALVAALIVIGNNDSQKNCVEPSPEVHCSWVDSPNPQIESAWLCNSGCLRWE